MIKRFKIFKGKVVNKYKVFELETSKVVDKYQLIKRSYFIGIGVNSFLLYKAIKKIAVLNEVENYIDTRRAEFEKTH